jgi:hypothetical protein
MLKWLRRVLTILVVAGAMVLLDRWVDGAWIWAGGAVVLLAIEIPFWLAETRRRARRPTEGP